MRAFSLKNQGTNFCAVYSTLSNARRSPVPGIMNAPGAGGPRAGASSPHGKQSHTDTIASIWMILFANGPLPGPESRVDRAVSDGGSVLAVGEINDQNRQNLARGAPIRGNLPGRPVGGPGSKFPGPGRARRPPGALPAPSVLPAPPAAFARQRSRDGPHLFER